MLLVRVVITILCAVGAYASVFMLRKTALAEAGKLSEPSIVQTPKARLFFGVPNALFGTLYYPVVLAVSWAAQDWPWRWFGLAAALCAAATSAYLAYSLLFVTRRACPYCWTAHAANWGLLAIYGWLLVLS